MSPEPQPDATVAYGTLPDQVLDVFLPPAATGLPLVIAVHGGFWRAEYDRVHLRPAAAALADAGWPTALIEYRRTGQDGGGWPGTFEDVATAVRRTPDLVAEVATARGGRAPAGPPLLLGHSAGGHLALWVAAGLPTAGVVGLAPVADLVAAHDLDLDFGAAAELLGGGPADVPERYAEADPAARAPLPAPVVLVHGDRDLQVPISISQRYRALAEAAGGQVALVELPDVDHFALIDPLSSAWGSVTSALRSLSQRSSTIDGPRGRG